MVLPGRELLAGAVEVDESYIGARRTGAAGRGVTGSRSSRSPSRIAARRPGGCACGASPT
jgi:hypothetical protein